MPFLRYKGVWRFNGMSKSNKEVRKDSSRSKKSSAITAVCVGAGIVVVAAASGASLGVVAGAVLGAALAIKFS